MRPIIKKEILHLLGNPTGFFTIGAYILFNGAYLFIFPDSNLFDNKYATLSAYIDVAPWVFIFTIPAIAMRTFSDEIRLGTIERLYTLPLHTYQIVLGKYIACALISLLCIVCSLPFLITVNALSENGFDVGATLGGYIALFFLSLVFNAISVFAAATSKQMIVAFFLGCLLCFALYFAFESLSQLRIAEGSWDYYLQLWGIQYHFNKMKRGALDSRDIVYFLSIAAFFILLSITYLNRRIDKR